MNTKEINFRQSMTAIEDLKSLVASDFKGIAEQALFHVQELKQNYDYDWNLNPENYSAVRNLLEGQLKGLFNFYVSTQKNIGKAKFKIDQDSFSLFAWNRLLNTLDAVLKTLSFFRFHGPLSIELKNNRLIVTGNLRKFKCEGEMRVRLYSLIRDFLKHETFFTFGLEEAQDGQGMLALMFDFSHREDQWLSFETTHGTLNFTGSLAQYEVRYLAHLQGLNHQVLVVDDSYQLSLENKIPDKYFQDSAPLGANFSVFHFSFLFRPVSLIIPKRGKLCNSAAQSGTYVDFFSIINN